MNPAPYPLTRRQRLGVRVWRGVLALATAIAKRRAPAPPAEVTEHRYGTHRDERLDHIAPNPEAKSRTPVVYIHGGGWVAGKKEMFGEPLYQLAESGHAVFNVEYPLAPERPHPHMLRSLLDALTWIKANHPETGSVHLVGDSAGGNLAMMLGIIITNPEAAKTLSLEGWPSTPGVASVTSLYGVLDRLSWLETGFPSARLFLTSYAGPHALATEIEPEHAITPMDLSFEHLPPTFIAAAGKDKLAQSSAIAAERLQAKYPNVEHKLYDGASHGFYTQGKRKVDLQKDVAEFIARNGSAT